MAMTPEIAVLLRDLVDELDGYADEMLREADVMRDLGDAMAKAAEQFAARMRSLGWHEGLLPKPKRVRRKKEAVPKVA